MNQQDRIRSITFWGLFMVSAFLSITLYIGLVDSVLDKGIMFVVSIAMEGLKVLALIWANTALWQALQLKSFYPHEAFRKKVSPQFPDLYRDKLLFHRKKRKAAGLLSVYALTALLSISASFGYILQTVEKATQLNVVVNTDSTQTVIQKQINLKEQTLSQNNKAIVQYNKMIDSLSIESKTYTKDFETLNKKIASYMDSNTTLLADVSSLNEQYISLQFQDNSMAKITERSMYQLMGDVLGISDRIIMFILLGALSFLIEIGIFVCSPHYHDMNDEDTVREKKPSSKPEVITLSPKDSDMVSEVLANPPSPTEALEKLIDSTPNSSQAMWTSTTFVPVPFAGGSIQVPPDMEKEITGMADGTIQSGNTVSSSLVGKKDEDEDVPIRHPVPRKKLEIEKYIEALFDNGGNTFLKDKVVACDEAGITRKDGAKYFNWLMTTKVNGYPIVEFRKESNNWFPNVTSEIAKSQAVSVFLKQKGEVDGNKHEAG